MMHTQAQQILLGIQQAVCNAGSDHWHARRRAAVGSGYHTDFTQLVSDLRNTSGLGQHGFFLALIHQAVLA